MKNPCFQALTRPVSWAGLPMSYMVLLFGFSLGGFIAFMSFVWLFVTAPVGYIALRAVANYDPRIADVWFITMARAPLPASWFKGKGIIYRA